MRVFVGTMACGEADLPLCLQSVASQQGVEITHALIENMAERDAHNALWDAWAAQRHDHDVFVKVDGDTVLSGARLISQVCAIFAENARLTGVQLPIHDFFTDGLICGLNAFSRSVIFNRTTDALFCDRVDSNHDLLLKVPPTLPADETFSRTAEARGIRTRIEKFPVAFHCHGASDVQSFHFGLHRALKGQRETIARVRSAWARAGDRRRRLALLGAESAATVDPRRVNYCDAEFKRAFDAAMRIVDSE